MHPAVSTAAEYVLQHQHLLYLIAFLISAIVANVYTPIQHSLLITSISWLLIWIPTIFRAGIGYRDGATSKNIGAWAAGAFLALAQICDRAAYDREGTWWTKALIPLLVSLIPDNGLWAIYNALPSTLSYDDGASDSNSEKGLPRKPIGLLTIMTVSANIAIGIPYTASSTLVLGLCSALLTATGLILFDGAIRSRKDESHGGRRGFMSANGTFSRRLSTGQENHHLTALRDVAGAMTIVCGIATYFMESTRPDALTWGPEFREFPGNWKEIQYPRMVRLCIFMIVAGVVKNITIFVMLFKQGAAMTSSLLVFSYIYARLTWSASLSGIWFTALFACAAVSFSSISSSAPDNRSSVRLKRILFVVAVISFTFLTFRGLVFGANHTVSWNQDTLAFKVTPPDFPLKPVPIDLTKGHPAEQLIEAAEQEFQDLLGRQSKSLADTIKEYRRRNGVPPPPNFDKWYEFSVRNGVQLIDEFDTLNRGLLPYWGLKPSTIRNRTKLALGFEGNGLIGIMIRDGNVVKVEGGQEWQQQATVGMMKGFVQHLPDMDLAFNIHDEPRVVVPHDQLSILVAKAKDESMSASIKNPSPRNQFSPRPADMNDGKRFEEAKVTRFNQFAHQQTWTHSRLSCSPDSQARNYELEYADNRTSYATSALGFVYNSTAFSDICNSPSLSETYGFFDRPNAFNIIHELTPIFSQSKVSSFQDILYPSPWYWIGKVGYDEERDTTWENKTNSLYWRGSTTGGFSRDGGWRRQHRQHVVRRLNAPDKAKVLVNKGDTEKPYYHVEELPRANFKDAIDVHFSHVGQCDQGDCDAQKAFFDVVDRVDGQDAWGWKHLLDIDGNAFSGRFYAFLKSRSLTYKAAIFREWHMDWLKPWVHYIPLSFIGDEHLELVKWFGGIKDDGKSGLKEGEKGGNGDSLGEKRAREIAERSTEWAKKVLRNEDFEAWFFRLLLEYGRIIDDNRESIGYPGP
ncbi:hypothetical protein GQ43DRAFT_482607 [Delitschia confertaspora ATCC 74209]|uniref:Glycosyl transferase CAP10 domain-containing protein n=1 Tax=Delitschia confertaspora ATCC 74209 TaxID=1513339 RepID=A0A9P4MNA9_9PLEO|nr:hypothetical protein GQ43DRAFT_482607 [Delitschia confertaspora ATCC 74209]